MRGLRRIILLAFFVASSILAPAQKNVIKGRAMMWVKPAFYSLGIGYERVLNKKYSIGVLYNKIYLRSRYADGGSTITKSWVPEMKLFLVKQSLRELEKAYFVAVFTEFSNSLYQPGGEQNPANMHVEGKSIMVNPGLIIGKNFRFSKHWYMELYGGVKYKFVEETNTYLVNNEEEINVTHSNEFGLRAGFNVGIRF